MSKLFKKLYFILKKAGTMPRALFKITRTLWLYQCVRTADAPPTLPRFSAFGSTSGPERSRMRKYTDRHLCVVEKPVNTGTRLRSPPPYPPDVSSSQSGNHLTPWVIFWNMKGFGNIGDLCELATSEDNICLSETRRRDSFTKFHSFVNHDVITSPA